VTCEAWEVGNPFQELCLKDEKKKETKLEEVLQAWRLATSNRDILEEV
jgi:hypothetical protein